jgi:hypothetical protein
MMSHIKMHTVTTHIFYWLNFRKLPMGLYAHQRTTGSKHWLAHVPSWLSMQVTLPSQHLVAQEFDSWHKMITIPQDNILCHFFSYNTRGTNWSAPSTIPLDISFLDNLRM